MQYIFSLEFLDSLHEIPGILSFLDNWGPLDPA